MTEFDPQVDPKQKIPIRLIVAVGVIVMICGLLLALAKPVYGVLRDARSSQLAVDALESYMENPKDPNIQQFALEKAQSAFFLSQTNYEANRTLAVLTLFSDPPTSLQYWKQSRDLWDGKTPIERKDQMHYVQALLLNEKWEEAEELLESILADASDGLARADVLYNLLKITYLRDRKAEALEYGREMIRSSYTPIERHLVFVDMCLSYDEERVRAEGEKHINFLLRNSDLVDDSVLWQMTQFTNLSKNTQDKLRELLGNRVQNFEERIELVNFQLKNGSIDRDEALSRLRRYCSEDDMLEISRLSEWCSVNGFGDAVSEMMDIDMALARKDWFLIYIKSLGMREEWERVLNILNKEDCPIEPYFLDIIKSEAYSELGSRSKAVTSWYRAKLSVAPLKNQLWLLVRIGDELGLEDATEGLLRELVVAGENPEVVLTYVMQRELEHKDYEAFYRRLSNFKELYRSFDTIQNDWAYFALLMKRDMEEAMLKAERLVDANPTVLRYHMTWCLGKIQAGQYREVLARLQQFDVEWESLHPRWRFILALGLSGVGEFRQALHYMEGVDLDTFNPYELELYEKHFYPVASEPME